MTSSVSLDSHRHPDVRRPAAVLLLAFAVLAIYWQTGNHAFVNLDDDAYIYGNPNVRKGLTPEGVAWAFTTTHAANWHPLTWISHMADVDLFGLVPGWHHRMNVLFHILNSVLLFLVLEGMTGACWRSGLVAALFAVHPLHVESVAWAAERKDVLSTFFWILATGAYVRYVAKPRVSRYMLVVLALALGLMAKPMVVTLPFTFLLLDYWPLGRMAPEDPARAGLPGSFSAASLPRLVREKIPLFALSAVSCVITFLAGKGAIRDSRHILHGGDIANIVVSYVAYLAKTVWPSSLSVFYPHPSALREAIPSWEVAGAAVLLVGTSLLVLRFRGRCPFLPMGWAWYLGTLVPVIGFIPVGSQAMADRYTYVPLIGIFVAVAWGLSEAWSGWRVRRQVAGIAAGAVLSALAAAAWVQAGYWKDSVALFTHALQVTKGNWFAWNNLGYAYDDLGRHDRAAEAYGEALRIMPNDHSAWNDLGASYARLGRGAESLAAFREALRLKPDTAEIWFNLGTAYGSLGRYPEAVDAYRGALRLRPDYAAARRELGLAYSELGLHAEAIASLEEALRVAPGDVDALADMGVACYRAGRREPLAEIYRKIRGIDPSRAGSFAVRVGLIE